MNVATARPISAGDPLPDDCEIITIRVPGLDHLFNAIDPAPFHEKDLDPGAEEFIVEWARELPAHKSLALLVHVDRQGGLEQESVVLREAVHQFFHRRAQTMWRRLRQLFRRGRISLLIGLSCVAGTIAIGDFIAFALGESRFGTIIRESLVIGGWVAMWRPMETFLYDWWPIRAEARVADRLAAMPVRVEYSANANADSAAGELLDLHHQNRRRGSTNSTKA